MNRHVLREMWGIGGIRWRLPKWKEKVQIWVAWHLPRWVVYWATVRCGVHGTTGQYSHQEVPALTVGTALRRWRNQ